MTSRGATAGVAGEAARKYLFGAKDGSAYAKNPEFFKVSRDIVGKHREHNLEDNLLLAEDKTKLRHEMIGAELTEVRLRFDFEGTKTIVQ